MNFQQIFPNPKPTIGCIHLRALPGAPLYDGDLQAIFDTALREAALYQKYQFDGIIIENFRDRPFYPNKVPSETVAAMAAIAREIVRAVKIPVGVNALRNDAEAALGIATAAGAKFIRVNVHVGAVVTDQGLIQGTAYSTLRLKAQLKSDVAIFADAGVKHAVPLAARALELEAKDIESRGMADALILSGHLTGSEANPDEIALVKRNIKIPVIIGSGIRPENLPTFFPIADGFIVGSYFKVDGYAENEMDEARLGKFTTALAEARRKMART